MSTAHLSGRTAEAPSREPRKRDLTPARRRLVEIMQTHQYGEIHELRISQGDPVLDPMPEVFRDVIPGRDNGPHPARVEADCALKREVVELFDLFDQQKNVQIVRLVIQAGLPLRVRLRVSSRIG